MPSSTNVALTILAGTTFFAIAGIVHQRSNKPSRKMSTTVFNVEMACGGCSGACQRILGKIDGVQKVTPDLDAQTVTVVGTADPALMLTKLHPRAHVPELVIKPTGQSYF